jgi:ribosomal protein S18 acetylase RimI-like enzyme
MEIINSLPSDLTTHMLLYNHAIAYQRLLGIVNWLGFDEDVVLAEIKANKHWKILVEGEIACVFLLEENDPMIWGDKDADPSIYVHRIATNPKFRGQSFVKHIVDFVRVYAKRKNKQFIRMDTLSGNDKLNNYYISKGFKLVGVTTIGDASDMPAHYHNNSFVLFEMEV